MHGWPKGRIQRKCTGTPGVIVNTWPRAADMVLYRCDRSGPWLQKQEPLLSGAKGKQILFCLGHDDVGRPTLCFKVGSARLKQFRCDP
jgi:hypothetical protein